MRSLLLFTVLTLFTGPLFAAVGFYQFPLTTDPDRTLNVTVWYPTEKQNPGTSQGDNPVFYGIEVQKEALPAAGAHPLVLLSHGYGGNWRNLNWLAAALVEKGYIVAAPDHPGTTTFHRDASAAAKLWLRPRDMSDVLDAILHQRARAGRIDETRIAAVGHSLGGWTVMALGGAQFSPAQFMRDCRVPTSPTVCKLERELGIASSAAKTHFARPLRDARIKAVVALDAGLLRGFTAQSLAAMPVPVLMLAAGNNIADLPVNAESGWLYPQLPSSTSQLHILPDASHFSFMQLCKPGAAQQIDAAEPGEGIICRDGGNRDRAALHNEIASRTLNFLSQVLDVPAGPLQP